MGAQVDWAVYKHGMKNKINKTAAMGSISQCSQGSVFLSHEILK